MSGFKALVLEGEHLVETSSVEDVVAAHAAEKPLWLQLENKTEHCDKLLTDVFKIHPLAVEDIWNDIGIPKVENFEDYIVLVMHGVRDCDVEGADIPLSLAELDVVIGRHFLITHANDEKICAVAPVRDEVMRNTRLMRKGPAWIAHALVDRLVDEYVPVVDRFEEQISAVEAKILEGHTVKAQRSTMRTVLHIKRSLQMLRRTTINQREILHRLARAEFELIPHELVPFFRDVYDHFARVTELVDSYRELTSGLLEAHFSIQNQQMNEIMKRLTLISTVMLPLTLIAGIYGMNFKGVFPELDWKYGYFYALGLMTAVGTTVIVFFKKQKWL